MSARQLFIYWRCAAAEAEAAQAAVRSLQAGLCLRHPGLSAELFLRVDGPPAPADVRTLMEVYAFRRASPGLPAGIDAALQAELLDAAQALQPWLRGARHVEVFDLLD